MKFLKKYDLTDKEIEKIKNNYNSALISSILYKTENVCLLLDYFKSKDFCLKSLLFNRLDIFLIDYDYFISKINKYNEIELIKHLKNDFSLMDNL